MKKYPLEAKFIQLLNRYIKLSKVRVDFVIRDIKLKDCVALTYKEKGKHYLAYNPKNLILCKNKIKKVIFHELGHLNHIYDNEQCDDIKVHIRAERFAERFALKMLQKYEPAEYQKMVEILPTELKNWKWDYPRQYHYYYDAFKYIKEYQSTP